MSKEHYLFLQSEATMDAFQVSWNALQMLVVLHYNLLKKVDKPRYQEVTEQSKSMIKARISLIWSCLTEFPVLYNSSSNPSCMNTW